jgi:hypothetical protein
MTPSWTRACANQLFAHHVFITITNNDTSAQTVEVMTQTTTHSLGRRRAAVPAGCEPSCLPGTDQKLDQCNLYF